MFPPSAGQNPFLSDGEASNDANVHALIAYNNLTNNNSYNGHSMVPPPTFTGINFPTNTTSVSHHASTSPAKPPRPGPPVRPPPPSSAEASNAFTADFAHANIPPPKPLPPPTMMASKGSAFDDLEDSMRIALGSPSKGGQPGGSSMFVSSSSSNVAQNQHFIQQNQQMMQQQPISQFVGGLVSLLFVTFCFFFFPFFVLF